MRMRAYLHADPLQQEKVLSVSRLFGRNIRHYYYYHVRIYFHQQQPIQSKVKTFHMKSCQAKPERTYEWSFEVSKRLFDYKGGK